MEANTPLKVIFDNNAWISFCMNSYLTRIETLFGNPFIDIYSCQNLIDEFDDVSSRERIQKYLVKGRPEKARLALIAFKRPFKMPISAPAISRDLYDDYFLYFSEQYDLDFIVTGDKDLLVLEKHGHTQIIKFNEFMSILKEKGLI